MTTVANEGTYGLKKKEKQTFGRLELPKFGNHAGIGPNRDTPPSP